MDAHFATYIQHSTRNFSQLGKEKKQKAEEKSRYILFILTSSNGEFQRPLLLENTL